MIWKVNKKINFANLCNTNINCFLPIFPLIHLVMKNNKNNKNKKKIIKASD